MAPRFELTSQAFADIDDLWNFIANDSVSAADRVQSAIFAAIRRLAKNPGIGQLRPGITPLPIRFWPVSRFPNYVIAYRFDSKPIQVVAVLHGRRDLATLMNQRQS